MPVLIAAAEQELLPFRAPADAPDVAWLESELSRVSGWILAKDLCALAGLENCEDHKRWFRHLAHASEWIISGQRGYKYLGASSAEEIDRCCNGLESQSRELAARAIRLRRAAHTIFG